MFPVLVMMNPFMTLNSEGNMFLPHLIKIFFILSSRVKKLASWKILMVYAIQVTCIATI